MPKVSALPEDTNPTLDDYTYTLDSTSTTAEKVKWSKVLAMLIGGIYPVGTIYTETNGVNPGTTFGFGTWVAFGAGRTLIGNGTSDQAFTAGATGGESNHVLSTTEMPVHGHGLSDPGHVHGVGGAPLVNAGGGGIDWTARNGFQGTANLNWSVGKTTDGSGTGISIANAGSGGAHNNLPPYIVVYFWKRVS